MLGLSHHTMFVEKLELELEMEIVTTIEQHVK